MKGPGYVTDFVTSSKLSSWSNVLYSFPENVLHSVVIPRYAQGICFRTLQIAKSVDAQVSYIKRHKI